MKVYLLLQTLLAVFMAVGGLMIEEASAQKSSPTMLPSGLTLTVWGAKIKPTTRQGKAWDLQSLPDPLVRVYLNGRLVKQSGVRKDELTPFWGMMVGPIPESQFSDGPLIVQIVDQDVLGEEVIDELLVTLPTQFDLGVMLELEGERVDGVAYQWGKVTSTDTSPSLKERSFNPKDSQQIDQKDTHKRRLSIAREAAMAAHLYRAYLRAQFTGDQLREHELLLKLVQQYPHTRHGRKARRLILLNGR